MIYSHDRLTSNKYKYLIKKENDENDEKLKILMNNDEKKNENIDEKFVQKVKNENENEEEKKNE
jgi:hypothetical protein